jgi:hypothetical protein
MTLSFNNIALKTANLESHCTVPPAARPGSLQRHTAKLEPALYECHKAIAFGYHLRLARLQHSSWASSRYGATPSDENRGTC